MAVSCLDDSNFVDIKICFFYHWPNPSEVRSVVISAFRSITCQLWHRR